LAHIFCCYAPQDRDLWLEFRKQLISLLYYRKLREEDLYACQIQTGIIWGSEVYEHLRKAGILILLISADFMSSDYRTQLDIERLQQTRVVPVILRPVHWQSPPLQDLQELPKNGLAITLWDNRDDALYTAAQELDDILDAPSKVRREKRQLPVVRPPDPALPALNRPWPWDNYTSLPSLVQHMGPIASLTLSSEAVLISDSRDQGLLYWYLSGEKLHPVKTLAAVEQPIYSVAFSPDASFVASGGADNQIIIQNPYTGEIKHTLTGHTGPVSCVAFSPDGQIVASASDDQTIKLWQLYTGQPLHTLNGHKNAVTCLAFSPDGQFLASGSYDETIKIWNAQQAYCHATLREHKTTIHCLIFHQAMLSLPGKPAFWDTRLVSGDHYGSIFIYRTGTRDKEALKSGKDKVWPLPPETWEVEQILQQTGPIYSLASHSAADAIISGGHDGVVRVWDRATGQTSRAYEQHTRAVSSLAVSQDGNIIISGSLDASIKVLLRKEAALQGRDSAYYPALEMCPACQEKIELATSRKISLRTLGILKEQRSILRYLPFKWRPQASRITVASEVRALCRTCDYAFPAMPKASPLKRRPRIRLSERQQKWLVPGLAVSILLIAALITAGVQTFSSGTPTLTPSVSPLRTPPSYQNSPGQHIPGEHSPIVIPTPGASSTFFVPVKP
jgi:hypothetical protein